GKAPLTVQFTGSQSFDPNGDPITFRWEFGNGDRSNEADPVYTYTTPGTYTATLTVEDPKGAADTFLLEIIVGSEPPVPTILSPANGASFFPHQTIALQGTASDPDEPESSLQFEWEIDLHHNDHIHPATHNFLGSFASIIPEDHGDPWDLIYLAIKLRVTDSSDLTREAVSYVVMKSEGEKDITEHGTPVALITNPSGRGNLSIEIIKDGIFPAVGSDDPSRQYDTEDGSHSRPEDWIGYDFNENRRFGKLIFQEGIHFEDGGWFDSLQVQVRVTGAWTDVAFMNSVPPYPGKNESSYEIFTLLFSPQSGDAIRIVGPPGGDAHFISVGELRVIETPFEPPQPSQLVLNPVHDSFVRENRAARNYGTGNELRVRKTSSAQQISYIKFNVTGVTGEVTQAVLRLHCVDGSSDGGTMHTVSNRYRDNNQEWEEDKLVWNNAPPITSAALHTIGSVGAGDTVEVDVTGLVAGDGSYSLAIANQSSDKAGFYSKETGFPPELIIDFNAPTVSTPEPEIISFSPSHGPVGSHVQISGNYLSEMMEVRLGVIRADHAQVLSDSQVEAEVPLGAQTGPISITTSGGTAKSLAQFIVVGGPSQAPVISSFNPTSGMPGTAVTITGSHLSTVSQVSFGGVLSEQISVVAHDTVIVIIPEGSSTGPISISNEVGTTITDAEFVVALTDPVKPRTLHFVPTDDSFVWSKKPSNNYDASAILRVRQTRSAEQIAYFKFHIQGTDGVITKAKLRLYAADGGNDAGSIHQVSNNYHGSNTPWNEAGLRWPNAPRLQGNPLASTGPVKAEELVEFDVTASVSGDGQYSYAVSNNSGDVVRYSSKEGLVPPELIIEINNGNIAAKFTSPNGQGLATRQTLAIPENVVMRANHPNPFNIETIIQYGLPSANHVRLEIYNIQGQRIRTLVDAVQPPGYKWIKWNGTNDSGIGVSSGLYFASLRTEKVILTQKLLLQK
ncbi:DNRLRE domain-containing protein, partial [bacterium]|nr:DNRLRE domain-containing protein [bacterium]